MNAPLSTCVTLPGISVYKNQGEEQREILEEIIVANTTLLKDITTLIKDI